MVGAEDTFSLRFRREADSLRERHGITLDALTPGEVAALVHAVERVCSPYSAVNADLADAPIPVCRGLCLWPPTVGAQLWLDEYASKWWPSGSAMFSLAQAWALANARDPGAFAGMREKGAARAAVIRFALRVPANGAELASAVRRAYGGSRHDAPDRAKSAAERMRERAQTDWCSLIASLEVESGIPRDVWLWGRSLVYAMAAYIQMHEFAAAFSLSGAERARMADELDDALRNLARVKMMIVDRVRRAARQDGEG